MNKLKHRSMITKIIVAAIIIFAIITGLTGCGAFESAMQDVKGSLIGDSYTVYFYDDYGAQFLTMEGDRIDMEGNYVLVDAHDPEMEDAQKMELSSVITITIDGHEVDTTGSTVIFEGSGIKKITDFSITELESDMSGVATITSISRNINEYKNMMGTSKVITIQSQMGVPICVYGGDDVYWEIPSDLPKTTKLMIDGKPLYIHRADYVLFDSELIR